MDFYKDSRGLFGVFGTCKVCFCARGRETWPEKYTPEIKAKKKQYRKNNRKRDRERLQRWRAENPEKTDEYNSKPRKPLTQAQREKVNARLARMRNADPNYRVGVYTRSRILAVLKGGVKTSYSEDLVGGFENLRRHLEKQFKPEWNWDNHGELWEIDHIRPLATFPNLGTSEEEQRQAFHYTNTQPLGISENRSKGARYNG